jgi:predicted transcriptional regulator
MQVVLKNQLVEKPSFSGTLDHQHNPTANIWEVLLKELYELGYTQKAIAESTQISIPTIKRLAKNHACPSPATFSKLLAFYCSVAMQI